ncbi:MAG: amidase, partial [Thermoguttaceae bacterium]|nr:amidase [Thermoguttaceae bacterium]
MHAFPAIRQLADEIRQGRLQPIELLDRCLDRIDRFDGEVLAWVAVDEAGARRDAEQMAREAAEGRWRGPLHGIPIGVKDIIDVGGLPTRAGSPLREHHVAQADAPLVAALRRAGAVIIGKTVTVEFACFDPSPTRNPWNLEHTPGGSSSGSAAAVAMDMCPAALGTQTGGSLVRPAGYCGVATFKPSLGRLNTEGIIPVSPHLDQPGPMARSVDDLMELFGLLDGSAAVAPPERPPPRLGVV